LNREKPKTQYNRVGEFQNKLKMSSHDSNIARLYRYFINQYPLYESAKDGSAIEFSDAGSDFRIYLPTGKIHSDGSMDLKVKLDHIKNNEPDDHAEINVSLDANGVYKSSPTVSYDMGNGLQIPDWAFYTVEGTMTGVSLAAAAAAGVVGGVIASPTGPGAIAVGVAVGVATTAVVEAVSWGIVGTMDLFNYLSKKISTDYDDGGTVYFTEVVTHTLNRLSTTALMYNHGDSDSNLEFDYDEFLDGIDQSSWNSKGGAAVKYKYDGHKYRTWLQDVSYNYDSMGLFISTKIDGIRDNHPDDHVILGTLYNAYGQLVSAQAVIVMQNEDTVSSGSVMYNENDQLVNVTATNIINLGNDYNDLADALKDVLKNEMKKSNHYSDYSDKRKDLPKVTRDNLRAMNHSIKYDD